MWFFVSREKTGFDSDKYAYTVRSFNKRTGQVDTVGAFQAYANEFDANQARNRAAKK